MEKRFDVFLLQPAREFLLTLPLAARKKVFYNLERASEKNDPELMKKLDGHIWEFRTLFNGIQYRLLAFWDPGRHRLVIATHGFIKKTDKVPGREIDRARSIRQHYLTGKTELP